jgi:hypothetical protein
MDIQKILSGLREQRDQVVAVIEALERISHTQTPRRGRPPKWLTLHRVQASKNGVNGSMNGSLRLPDPKKSSGNSSRAAGD